MRKFAGLPSGCRMFAAPNVGCVSRHSPLLPMRPMERSASCRPNFTESSNAPPLATLSKRFTESLSVARPKPEMEAGRAIHVVRKDHEVRSRREQCAGRESEFARRDRDRP